MKKNCTIIFLTPKLVGIIIFFLAIRHKTPLRIYKSFAETCIYNRKKFNINIATIGKLQNARQQIKKQQKHNKTRLRQPKTKAFEGVYLPNWSGAEGCILQQTFKCYVICLWPTAKKKKILLIQGQGRRWPNFVFHKSFALVYVKIYQFTT